MAEQRLGIIMHGVTGRMGYNQHLVRSILAIRDQGGIMLKNGDRLVVDPIIVGRDRDKIEALAKNDPTLFDRVLPFALVFGLEDKWANAFRDMYREPPTWYSSPGYRGSFTPNMFVSDLGRSLGVMNSSMASTPRKSGGSGLGGGGSSGGGFGGGGGGSW